MLKHVSEFFWRIAGLKTFIAAVAVYTVFGGYIMPQGAEYINEINGSSCAIFDLQFHYTPDRAREIISCYSDAGRAFAIKFDLIADTLYPLCYTFLFIIIMAWIYKSASKKGAVVPMHIHLFPFTTIALDYCENTGIVTLLSTYPDFSNTIALITSAFTTAKWSTVIVQLLIIIYGLLMLWIPRLRSKG